MVRRRGQALPEAIGIEKKQCKEEGFIFSVKGFRVHITCFISRSED